MEGIDPDIFRNIKGLIVVIFNHIIHRYRLMRYHLLIFIDHLRKIDLTEAVSVEKLHLNPEISQMYYASSPTLKNILKRLKIRTSDKIIDMGCGKGMALYYMSKFPFHHIAGVEISSELADICEKNFCKLNIRNYKIYNMDASVFKEYDMFNYIYFYNPFNGKIFEKCLINIEESLLRVPRKITIIYHNAVFNEIVLNHNFKLVKKLHFNRFYIYENIN